MLSMLPSKDIHKKWNLTLKEGLNYSSLGSDLTTLHFYQFLIRQSGATAVLELGAFVGVSTLYLAEAVGRRGHVTTVEFGDEFCEIAASNFANNSVGKHIDLIQGDALTVLTSMREKRFDMIFMDAAKQDYGKMLEPALELLCPHGFLIVDDILYHGDALNPTPVSDKGKGIHDILNRVKALPLEYKKVLLPIGDGILIISKAIL